MPRSKRDGARVAMERSAAAKYGRIARRKAAQAKPEERLQVIGHGTTCWCGEPMGHDWPGRDEGAPHPR